jgi:hypothetical protein
MSEFEQYSDCPLCGAGERVTHEEYDKYKNLQSSLSAAVATLKEIEGCRHINGHISVKINGLSSLESHKLGHEEAASIVTKFFDEHPELKEKKDE